MSLGSLVLGTAGVVATPISIAPPALQEVERSVLHVDPSSGTRVEHERLWLPPTATALPAGGGSGPQAIMQLPAGQLWSRSSPNWVGRVISLGDRGTQVFTELDSGLDHAELLSGFDESPAAPIWQSANSLDLAQAVCASAHDTDIHVTLHQVVTNNDQQHRQPRVQKYTSTSLTPDWTYSFPFQVGGVSRLSISRNGQVIAAAIQNQFTSRAEVVFLAPGSPVPTGTLSLSNFIQLRGFELSADGSTLYISSSTGAYLYDVATRTLRGQVSLPSALDCHALSGDGSVFAYGTFGTLVLWQRQAGGNYAWLRTHAVPGVNVCSEIDISDDNSTVAVGWSFWDTNLHVLVQALDVASGALRMEEHAYGTGTLQNIVSDISLSADGSRFAVGLWGDEGGVCPEVRIYNRDSNTPLKLYDLPGSVFDVDLSADGQRLAVASKAVHANTFASGGTLALYAVTREDLRVSGIPRLGSQVLFTLRGNPGQAASLLWTLQPALNPTTFGSMGTLQLHRPTLQSIPLGIADAQGEVEYAFTLPSGAADIGRTLWFQGFSTAPRRLSADYVNVTIVP